MTDASVTRRLTLGVAMALASGLVAACGATGPDAENGSAEGTQGSVEAEPGVQSEWYEEAIAAGGRVTVFVGTSATSELEQVKSAFQESYPDVTLEWVSGTGDKVSERLLTEKRAGLDNADVLQIPSLKTIKDIDAEGYIEHHVPEDADLFSYDEAGYVEGVGYSHSQYLGAVCYNPNNVTEEEIALLSTYEGQTDPVFAGRAAITSPAGFMYRRHLTYWLYEDEDLGLPWLQKLAELKPVVYDSANVSAPMVIAGEYDVVYNASGINSARAAQDGAPLECVTPSPAPATTFSIGIVKDAPNMAGAKLYQDWVLSEEGQLAFQDSVGYQARREGLSVPIEGDVDMPDEVVLVNEETVEANYSELVSTFEDLFGAARES